MESMKLVVVGDAAIGKTSLLMRYALKKFPTEHVPTVFDNYSTEVHVGNKSLNLNLWDTAGQEFFDNLRTFSYSDTDIFLLCFSLIDNESYTNAYKKWYPELKEHNKKAKIILVATKVDFRNSRSDTITTEKGKELAKKIKAKGYFECSSKTGENVKSVFDKAITVFLESKGKCVIL